MQELLKKTIEECRPTAEKGHVATYIPELEKENPNDFGNPSFSGMEIQLLSASACSGFPVWTQFLKTLI